MVLYVDKVQPNGTGGFTIDMEKIRFNLSELHINEPEFIAAISKRTGIPTAMFEAGRYIVIFQCNREFTQGRMAFLDYQVDLKKGFDHIADSLTPKVVGELHSKQQKISGKSQEVLNSVALSDNWPIFQRPNQN
ncbi:MAG: hypothetical protein AAFZ15_04315 [Bacteroidota bacterium]